jgi:hypothetical protein
MSQRRAVSAKAETLDNCDLKMEQQRSTTSKHSVTPLGAQQRLNCNTIFLTTIACYLSG